MWYRKLGYSSHNQHYDFFAGKIRRVIGSEIKFLQVTKTCSLGYAHGWLFRICWVKFVEYSYSCLLSIPYFTPSRLKKKTTKSCSFSWLARTIHCLSQYLVSICFTIFVASLMSFRWFSRLVGIGNRIVMMPRHYNRALGISSYCCIRLFTVTWAQQEKCFLILRKFIITHKLLSTEAFISSIMCYERKKNCDV